MTEPEQLRKELDELRERVANMERNQNQYRPGTFPSPPWPTVNPPVQYPPQLPTIPWWTVTCGDTK